MASVELTDGEWQQVLGILAMAPWRDANPLLMKIGEQLRVAQQRAERLAHVPSNSSGEAPSNMSGNSARVMVTPEMKASAIKVLDDLKQ